VTGEDVAELHLHGGRAIVTAVLRALGRIEGLREAQAGEFTRRAFENGRIDLAEAEGLADLLEAETETQRRSAMALAGGALSRQVEVWQERLIGMAAEVESALDFSDEDDVTPLGADFAARVEALRSEMANWLSRAPAERLKDGIRVVISGPPNSGKSRLLNALLQREAAIVSDIPGTTRDVIEAPVSISGIPFVLVDTAGLRSADDRVEAIGVRLARATAEAADLVLWLGPPGERPERAVQILPKADLQPPDGMGLPVSARTGLGLDSLTDLLTLEAGRLLPRQGEVALNARHRTVLADVADALAEAQAPDLVIVAEALRRARTALDRVTGRAGVEDMLDSLFGRFCIGK